jgi:hypothetical protein
MGMVIVDENGTDLMSGGRLRIETFASMTQVVSQSYRIPMPEMPMANDFWYIDSSYFCTLVENVFDSPYDLFYAWAQYAAGMYDMIKGQKHQWFWSIKSLPYMPLRLESWEEFEVVIPKDAKYSAPVPLLALYVGVDIPEQQSDVAFGLKP